MRRLLLAVMTVFGCLSWGPIPEFAWAQSGTPPAAEHVASAEALLEAHRFEEAMLELERAWRLEEQPDTLALRVLALEGLGEYRLALDVLEQNRAFLVQASPRLQLTTAETRLREHLRVVAHAEPAERSWAGPVTLLVAGAGLAAWSVYLLWPTVCQDDACRTQSHPNVVAGVGLGVGAVAAWTGALWWGLP